jgi:hypothetical protein
MKKVFIIIATLFAAIAVRAADTIKITVKQEGDLFAAIQALDGLPTAVKIDGSASSKIVVVPYHITAHARLILARDLVVLQASLQSADKARQGKFLEHSPDGKDIPPKTAEFVKYSAEIDQINSTVDELPLQAITALDLNLDANEGIGGSTLAALSPIIKQAP